MDAYDVLLSALLKDEGSYQTEDPFYQAGTNMDSVLATMPKYHLKPWEAVLAGALGGFGSGVLKGIGTASADQKTAALAEDVTTGLGLHGTDRTEYFKSHPSLAKYGTILGVQGVEEEQRKADALSKLKDSLLEKGITLADNNSMSLAPGYSDILTQEAQIKASAERPHYDAAFLAQHGIPLNAPPEQVAAMLREASDAQKAALLNSKANQTSIDRLADVGAGIDRINQAEEDLKKVAGSSLPNIIAGPLSKIEQLSGTSNAAQYQKSLPALESFLSGAFSRSSRGGLNRTLEQLHNAISLTGTSGPGAVIQALEGQKSDLLNIGRNIVDTGNDAGKDRLAEILMDINKRASNPKLSDESERTYDSPPQFDRATQRVLYDRTSGKYKVISR